MKLESSLPQPHGLLFLAPVLDAILVLSVFLLIGSRFVEQSGVAIELPVTRSAMPALGRAHIITISGSSSPQIFLDQERITLEALRRRVSPAEAAFAAASPTGGGSITYLLRADQAVPIATVMAVSEAVLAGGHRLVFATRPEHPPS
ncbi:MAG TPA: biopolymer transporter ExbD [Verrucomicrobiales bacterium]|nr:biopolymer transporter ExbD [Verrucomicrobiales bacterium]